MYIAKKKKIQKKPYILAWLSMPIIGCVNRMLNYCLLCRYISERFFILIITLDIVITKTKKYALVLNNRPQSLKKTFFFYMKK